MFVFLTGLMLGVVAAFVISTTFALLMMVRLGDPGTQDPAKLTNIISSNSGNDPKKGEPCSKAFLFENNALSTKESFSALDQDIR